MEYDIIPDKSNASLDFLFQFQIWIAPNISRLWEVVVAEVGFELIEMKTNKILTF